MTCKEKLTRAEVKVEHLQQQTETLRTMQARLAHEKEALMKDQQSQNKLQASLQAIQVRHVLSAAAGQSPGHPGTVQHLLSAEV